MNWAKTRPFFPAVNEDYFALKNGVFSTGKRYLAKVEQLK
jgi:hypothetical protein